MPGPGELELTPCGRTCGGSGGGAGKGAVARDGVSNGLGSRMLKATLLGIELGSVNLLKRMSEV